MKRVIAFFAAFFLLPLSSFANRGALFYATDDSVTVWGGYGRSEGVYSCADTDEKVIALTFDDGPHPRYTDEILDILKEHGVKGTFFVIGRNAESYPKKLKRIAEEGHEIGNHTYTHVTAGKTARTDFKSELERTHEVIKKITGISPVLFRPPTGYCDTVTVKTAAEMNCKIIVWTVDTRDWTHASSESIIKTVKSHVTGGSIVLFHDYVSAPSPTPRALSELIPYLKDQGYRFVTVSELLSYDSR